MPSGKGIINYFGAMRQIPQLFVYKYFMGQFPLDIKIVGQIPFSQTTSVLGKYEYFQKPESK